MTIIEGITAATQAIGLLKELRDIDRSVDEAAYRLKMADISSALADAKNALSDANLVLTEKKVEIANLKSALDEATSGEICPKCREGRMQLRGTEIYSFRGLGRYGVEEWLLVCDNSDCQFEQNRLNDPHGAIKTDASRR